jgi:hypothetical protein
MPSKSQRQSRKSRKQRRSRRQNQRGGADPEPTPPAPDAPKDDVPVLDPTGGNGGGENHSRDTPILANIEEAKQSEAEAEVKSEVGGRRKRRNSSKKSKKSKKSRR